MTAFALAHLRETSPHPEVAEYLERIDATLAPFDGRFIVHGSGVEVLEGSWPGVVVVIEFPSLAQARSWYDSAAYREIKSLRTRHIPGDVILVEGVGPGHRSAELAAGLRRKGGG